MVGDKVYVAVLPPAGNTRKLQLQWSRPLQITEIINPVMYIIWELTGKKPREYLAHRSKLRLCRKNGERDVNPKFILPRLPPNVMQELQLVESSKQSEENSEASADEMFESFATQGGDSSPEQLTRRGFR